MGGGGLSVQSAIYDVTITDSVISGNTLDSTFVDDSGRVSRLSGAGLRAYQANTGLGNLVVSKSTFDSNTITSAANLLRIYGAGIAEAMNMTLSYSTLSANDSAGYAGALMARGFFPCAISNSTFSGNHASGKGGAIFGAGPISLDSSTVAFNSSDSDAGGVYFNDNALFSSSIVARNNGAPHPDFMVSSTAIVTGNNDFIGADPGVPGSPELLSTLSSTRLDGAFPQPFVTWEENQLIMAEAAYQVDHSDGASIARNALQAVWDANGVTLPMPAPGTPG